MLEKLHEMIRSFMQDESKNPYIEEEQVRLSKIRAIFQNKEKLSGAEKRSIARELKEIRGPFLLSKEPSEQKINERLTDIINELTSKEKLGALA